jgi:hypothetical protein
MGIQHLRFILPGVQDDGLCGLSKVWHRVSVGEVDLVEVWSAAAVVRRYVEVLHLGEYVDYDVIFYFFQGSL